MTIDDTEAAWGVEVVIPSYETVSIEKQDTARDYIVGKKRQSLVLDAKTIFTLPDDHGMTTEQLRVVLDASIASAHAALEEAAKVAEDINVWKDIPGDFEANSIATAIRSLKR